MYLLVIAYSVYQQTSRKLELQHWFKTLIPHSIFLLYETRIWNEPLVGLFCDDGMQQSEVEENQNVPEIDLDLFSDDEDVGLDDVHEDHGDAIVVNQVPCIDSKQDLNYSQDVNDLKELENDYLLTSDNIVGSFTAELVARKLASKYIQKASKLDYLQHLVSIADIFLKTNDLYEIRLENILLPSRFYLAVK